jgi:hypothetical protein
VRTSALGKPQVAVALGFLIALLVESSSLAPPGFANLVQSESPAPQASSTMPALTGLRPGTKIVAVLQTTLDVLATKSGDEIAARVTKNLRWGGRIIVHEGDRLVGRVTRVQPQRVGEGKDDSEVAIAFDRLRSGASTYRLNTVIHSVLSIPGQRRGKAVGTEGTPPPSVRGAGLRGPHPGPSAGPAASGLHSGTTVSGPHAGTSSGGNEAGSSAGYPREGAVPSDFIKARSRPATDGRTGAVSVLSDRRGNLRLRAGTRLDFRTQGN